MAEGTDARSTNVRTLLRGHLRNSSCRAYALDMKVHAVEVLLALPAVTIGLILN
jgi:hypothetical protein